MAEPLRADERAAALLLVAFMLKQGYESASLTDADIERAHRASVDAHREAGELVLVIDATRFRGVARVPDFCRREMP